VRPSLVPVLLSRRAAISGGSTAFDPANVSGLMQRFLDTNPGYHGSTLGGLPILNAEESGTLALPRGQTCLSFDGVNDFGEVSGSSGMISSSMSFGGWYNLSSIAGNYCLIAKGTNAQWQLFVSSSSISLQCGGSTLVSFSLTGVSGWGHWFATVSGTTGKIYRNGVEVASGTVLAMPTADASLVRIGLFTTGVWAFSGQLRDVRIYSVAKTAGEVLAIANQHLTPTTIDTAGLVALYWLNEESGPTAFDSFGNNDLTLTNGPTWATDAGVNYNPANWLGHTVSGAVVIPRNESSTTQDAAGNALGVVGPLKHPATTEVRCVTGNGSAAYVDLGSALIPTSVDFSLSIWYYHVTNNATRRIILAQGLPANNGALFLLGNVNGGAPTAGAAMLQIIGGTTVNINPCLTAGSWHYMQVTRVGSTFTLSVTPVAGSLLTSSGTMSPTIEVDDTFLLKRNDATGYHNNGYVSDFRITTGGVTKTFPLQEGPGTANTNRDRYWIGSDGTSGVVSNADVNGTVASINANYCPYARDWCMENGGGIAANGAFIPGRIGTGLDALGNAKTLVAGEHGNPYSLLVRNPFSTPELVNIGIPSSNKIAPSVDVQAASVVDTQFNRILADGTDRYLAYQTALTGADKTNTEGYTT